MLDPLDTLTFVASQTKKIFLGTSVLDLPYYNPVMLARRLTFRVEHNVMMVLSRQRGHDS